MSDLVRIPLENGGAVLVERVGTDGAGPVRATTGRSVITEAGETMEKALASVRRASEAVLAELGKAGPDEITVEFGVTLSAEAGAFIAKAAAESHLAVKLTWKRADGAPAGAPAPDAAPPAQRDLGNGDPGKAGPPREDP